MPLTTQSIYPPASQTELIKWPSRRSVVHSTKGIVSCTQPLAAKCGIDILDKGGNAADAAVAVAAAMNVTEPCSTGIGGDMFCLYFDAAASTVSALNGSGRSPLAATIPAVRSALRIAPTAEDKNGAQNNIIPFASVHAVTVPGAAAGWVDTVSRFGSGALPLSEILEPAARLAEEGFPVSELTGRFWTAAEKKIRRASPNFAEMLKRSSSCSGGQTDGLRAPAAGDVMRMPNLARTLRALGKEGKAGFYAGRVAEEIVRVTRDLGGLLEMGDLRHHMETGSEAVDPISLDFRRQELAGKTEGQGVTLWEHPPNGQGIVALMALGILQELEKQGKIPTFGPNDHNTAPYLHAIIESLRLGFADASWYVTDPAVVPVPSAALLSEPYLASRACLFDPVRASPILRHGDPLRSPALQSSDTVYFAVSDRRGNAVSFINSNYASFGTGIVPRGCGFTLQNRGASFSLDEHRPNALAPRKRPYHTIIPALATNLDDGSLHSVFGVMGGFMQPQGHVQVLLGQVVGGLSPQQALDAPRVYIGAGVPSEADQDGYDRMVSVEEGMPESVVEGLQRLGHKVRVVRGMGTSLFGRGQIIRWTVDEADGTGVWSAGSDMRGDGAAYPA